MSDTRRTGDDPTLPDIRRDPTAPVVLEAPVDAALAEQIDTGDEEDPTSLAVRLDALRRHYLPLPDELVHEYLGEDEYVIHTDHPSFRAFLIKNTVQVLGLGAAGLAFLIFVRGGFDLWTLLFFAILLAILAFLAARRLSDHYTSYVITNLRLIRLSGIFGRKLASIPWTRMTGLGYRQKPMGRILGYATIFIESANEESGLREFSDINDPAAFHQKILDMVSAKSGQSSKEDLPPTRGVRKTFMQRRRERRTASLERARRVAREVARARKTPDGAAAGPDLKQPKSKDGSPKKGIGKPPAGPLEDSAADDQADFVSSRRPPPEAARDPDEVEYRPPRQQQRAQPQSDRRAAVGQPAGPAPPGRETVPPRGRLWPGSAESPTTPPQGVPVVKRPTPPPAPTPAPDKPAVARPRAEPKESVVGRLWKRVGRQRTPGPGAPATAPKTAPPSPARATTPTKAKPEPPAPPPPPAQGRPEAPATPPPSATPSPRSTPADERSPRVHRWWRNYRPEETSSARDALGSLRRTQRESRPARRVRLPSFGRPRSPLPESRQLPAKTEGPTEDTPDSDEQHSND